MMCPTFCFITSNTPELFNVPSREIENIVTSKMVFPFTSFSTRILNMKKLFDKEIPMRLIAVLIFNVSQIIPNSGPEERIQTWSGNLVRTKS